MKTPLHISTLLLGAFLGAPHNTQAQTAKPATTFNIGAQQTSINVMKNAMPPLPPFSKIARKAGTVRGFVKDWKGRPLQGAIIGVRSTAVGGFYSGAQGKSDAKGYYEIKAPMGAASFYCAGYTVNWGEGRAAIGLHPADGDASQFSTLGGSIENWVLLPYGVADRDGASESPHHAGNYYGGTFTLGYSAADPHNEDDSGLPVGAQLELTLAPIGPLFDGSQGQTFVFRRPVEEVTSMLYINNVPLGRYRLSAKMTQNGATSPLKIKETGPYSSRSFGLDPKEASGETTLIFRPTNAKAAMVLGQYGNWESLDITLSR